MNFKKIKLNVLFETVLLFVLTYFIGFLTLIHITNQPEIVSIIKSNALSKNPRMFIFKFFIVTAIFLLLLPLFKKKPVFLRGLYYLIIFIGISFVLEVFLGQPLSIFIALVLIICLAINPRIIIHNILFIVALAGSSIIISLNFDSISIVYILVALAFYDLIAVYITQHMLKMAKIFASKGVYFGIIIPNKSKDFLAQKTSFNLEKKGNNYFGFLGGGDIAFPLTLALSIASINLIDGIIVSLFSLLGLILLHFIFNLRKDRKPMPGLPPLVFMTILGYFIVMIS